MGSCCTKDSEGVVLILRQLTELEKEKNRNLLNEEKIKNLECQLHNQAAPGFFLHTPSNLRKSSVFTQGNVSNPLLQQKGDAPFSRRLSQESMFGEIKRETSTSFNDSKRFSGEIEEYIISGVQYEDKEDCIKFTFASCINEHNIFSLYYKLNNQHSGISYLVRTLKNKSGFVTNKKNSHNLEDYYHKYNPEVNFKEYIERLRKSALDTSPQVVNIIQDLDMYSPSSAKCTNFCASTTTPPFDLEKGHTGVFEQKQDSSTSSGEQISRKCSGRKQTLAPSAEAE